MTDDELHTVYDTRRRLRFLADLEIFNELDRDTSARLAGLLREQAFATDDVIFRHDQAADALYLVRRGTVALFRDEVGKPLQLLARYKAGDYLGLLGLFDGSKRRGTARVTEPALLYVIDREPLLALLDDHPQAALKLHMAAARRHSENVATMLGVGPRDEVRIRVDRRVSMRLPDGNVRRVVLENLSSGGLSLGDAPASWRPPAAVRFSLDLAGEPLDVEGRVSWRSGAVLGIAFTDAEPGHAERVRRALRRLLYPQTAA